MKISFDRSIWTIPTICLALWGCAVGPNYKAPKVEAPDNYSEIGSATQPTTEPAAGPSTQASTRPDYQSWWETLNDPELNRLIAQAVQTNPDVLAATARIREARGERGVVTSGLFPQVNATGSYTHTRDSQNLPGISELGGGSGSGFQFSGLEADLWQAGFDATWEIDVFGGTRRAIEAAQASVDAASSKPWISLGAGPRVDWCRILMWRSKKRRWRRRLRRSRLSRRRFGWPYTI
jgi:outer membrane protein, multidrug efflux system